MNECIDERSVPKRSVFVAFLPRALSDCVQLLRWSSLVNGMRTPLRKKPERQPGVSSFRFTAEFSSAIRTRRCHSRPSNSWARINADLTRLVIVNTGFSLYISPNFDLKLRKLSIGRRIANLPNLEGTMLPDFFHSLRLESCLVYLHPVTKLKRTPCA